MFFFMLMNKPGMIVLGTQETFNNEQAEGYAPRKISQAVAMRLLKQGEDLWVAVGDSYRRYVQTVSFFSIPVKAETI